MKKCLFIKYLFWIALMMLQTTAAQADNNKIYNAKSVHLPNGMQLVVIENHRTPAVTHMVWYRIGGADETIGESGLAHYLEHLMFKGSDLVPSGEFSQKVKSWGGNDNAFTAWDYTAYFQTVPKERLEAVMLMEADRMKNLNFSDEEALTERDVVIQERKQRTDSNPKAQLSESMRAALFVNHPYGRPIIGWDHEIQKLSPQSARDFYKKYYTPKNAILVVSGDVTAKNVFEMANTIYGKIKNDNEALSRPEWAKVPDIYGSSLIIHDHSSVKQPIWRKIFRVPSIGKNYTDSLALSIAEDILSKNSGILYEKLVMEHKLASAVHFHYSDINIADGTISIGISPLENINASQVDQAINAILLNIAENGITPEQLNHSIQRLQDAAIYERDSLEGPAMMIGYQLAAGLPLEKIESWATDLENITVHDIQRVVSLYLLPSSHYYHAVTGYLVPDEAHE